MSEHKEKRRYTREFKLEAVRLYKANEKSMREIEQELGITPYLLSKWVQQFREQEVAVFPGKGKLPEKDAELQRLRREVEILRQERDILKKAVVIFSEPKR
jgi:transposase